MQDFMTWIDARTFNEWVGFLSLITALIVGFISKDKLFKKSVRASKHSVAFGDNANGNTTTVNSNAEKDKEDVG